MEMLEPVYHLEKVLPKVYTEIIDRGGDTRYLIVTVEGYTKPYTLKIPKNSEVSVIDYVCHAIYQITGGVDLLQTYGFTWILNGSIMDASVKCSMLSYEPSRWLM